MASMERKWHHSIRETVEELECENWDDDRGTTTDVESDTYE